MQDGNALKTILYEPQHQSSNCLGPEWEYGRGKMLEGGRLAVQIWLINSFLNTANAISSKVNYRLEKYKINICSYENIMRTARRI